MTHLCCHGNGPKRQYHYGDKEVRYGEIDDEHIADGVQLFIAVDDDEEEDVPTETHDIQKEDAAYLHMQ